MATDDLHVNDRLVIPGADLSAEYTRSGGPGGQHVNTSDTSVRLRLDLAGTQALHPAVKRRIQDARARDINQAGELLVTSERHRSRQRNLDDARDKLATIIRDHLHPPKPRRPTKPTKGSKKRRLASKRARSDTKKMRGRIRRDD